MKRDILHLQVPSRFEAVEEPAIRPPKRISEKQTASIRKNWARIQRFGRIRFIALATAALWMWMVLCWIGFVVAFGNARVLDMAFVWSASLPAEAVMSLAAILCSSYLRISVQRLDAAI
jgi:hypothetical protein